MVAYGESLSGNRAAELLGKLKSGGAAQPKPAPRKFKSISEIEAVVRTRRERALAETIGVDNPYYRLHEARAGATSMVAGKPIVNFTSYDYLGLNGHPEIVAAVAATASEWGTSVSASRLTSGERPAHLELERRIASLYGVDDALVFVGGYSTNVSLIGDLLGPKDWILHDALIHNSCVMGAKLSGATRRAFPHNDLAALEALLAEGRDRFENVLIVTEGLFSMDGDGPDLAGLVRLKEKYGCWLMVDDAHALGVLGRTGRGIHEEQGVDARQVDIWMGTLSKTTVSCGGYVAGSKDLTDFARYRVNGMVYSVGMPATAAVAAATAIDLMLREPERVARLQANGRLFVATAKRHGLDTGTGWGRGVVPIIVGDSVRTLYLAQRLLDRGFNAFPVLPPGVPEKSARLRFFISSEHTPEQIEAGVAAAAEELDRLHKEGISITSMAARMMG